MPLYPVDLSAPYGDADLLLNDFLKAHHGRNLGHDVQAEEDNAPIIVDLTEEDAIILSHELFVEKIDIPHEEPHAANFDNPQDFDFGFH